MASRSTTNMRQGLRTVQCSCKPTLRFPSPRYQSTNATESNASSSPRIVAAALLSRPPLILPSLSPFERSYYAYQRKIHRALSKPLETSTGWFFKKGSTAEKSFKEFDKKVEKESGTEDDMRPFEMAREEVEGASLVMEKETAADKQGDVKSLERKADRTVYLLLKKKRSQHAWQFPQGGVEGDESLVEAARRELVEETGPNMDVWTVGRVPAGAYTYSFPPEHVKKNPGKDSAAVFFMPMRVVRGQAVPNQKEGLIDFAWLTKEEIKEKVDEKYWQAVEPLLSDL
ncbi:mitochondrial 54S ribosomal protein mL46 MRPL17 [Sporobolomyces salmoneus]|uniref:mitochondrial 54S ribosomal protein mL46 MRPL17 n=1 Tax=Sporobolomyces salmoneus TaxID=183962 RepID=UPI003171AB7A